VQGLRIVDCTSSPLNAFMAQVGTSFISGAIPFVYVLIGIREIRPTQLDICYYIVLLRQPVSTLSRGHHQAVDEAFIKS
jgi:hypothetical protein